MTSQEREETTDGKGARRGMPDGVWSKCEHCRGYIFSPEFKKNYKVCPHCGFHYALSAKERIQMLTEGQFEELWADLRSTDPLEFEATKSYKEALEEAKQKTGLEEAVITGRAKILETEVILAVMEFGFIGGSMGSVVGEKVTRAAELATSEKLPLFTVVSSGGARMQEGMFSLMQMVKTSAAVARLSKSGTPYISLLTNPSTGGVLASFAALADVIVAEPGALIGFTGRRVIEQTIKEKLPRDFQKAEFLLDHGLIDMIVARGEQARICTELARSMGGT